MKNIETENIKVLGYAKCVITFNFNQIRLKPGDILVRIAGSPFYYFKNMAIVMNIVEDNPAIFQIVRDKMQVFESNDVGYSIMLN